MQINKNCVADYFYEEVGLWSVFDLWPGRPPEEEHGAGAGRTEPPHNRTLPALTGSMSLVGRLKTRMLSAAVGQTVKPRTPDHELFTPLVLQSELCDRTASVSCWKTAPWIYFSWTIKGQRVNRDQYEQLRHQRNRMKNMKRIDDADSDSS